MIRIAIIFFSGAGNTKAVAERIWQNMAERADADIFSVESIPEDFSWEDYSAAVIGTPTYHSWPAEPLMRFLGSAAPEGNIPAFLFTTCGMYPENCLRTLAKECRRKGIIPVAHASYRCAATDGILLTPWMKCWHGHERNLHDRIRSDTDEFLRRLTDGAEADMPRYKWYAPLNYPNKKMGKAVTVPIYLHREICTGCGKCARNCPVSAIAMNGGSPEINKDRCINCYRCVHHCPALALSLSRRRRVKKVWRRTI